MRCKGKTLLDIENKKYVEITQQCCALSIQVNFPANNLNFHWRWRWWDQMKVIFLNLFYFTFVKIPLLFYIGSLTAIFLYVLHNGVKPVCGCFWILNKLKQNKAKFTQVSTFFQEHIFFPWEFLLIKRWKSKKLRPLRIQLLKLI